MNRLEELFNKKSGGILSIFYTAGYPSLKDTMPVLEALQNEGVDLVELGMPFSDPLADGPVIQESSMKAIENGMTLPVLFDQIKNMRDSIHIPVVLMGYVNTVMQYGVEAFCLKCAEVGIDGVILPDLPFYEYETFYRTSFEKAGLVNVFLITPQTSAERIEILDRATKGFLYLVSSASTTGSAKTVDHTTDYLKRIKSLNLRSNTLVGFNIKDRSSFEIACEYSKGAIVGSAFVTAIAKEGSIQEKVKQFIKSIR